MSGIDKAKFKLIFEEYHNALCNFAFGFMNDRSKAEDVVQDVFVKFWMKRHEIDESKNIKSFLFFSTRNRAIEIIRRNTLDNTMKASKIRDVGDTAENDKEADKFMLKDKLFASIRQLPPKCQEVFKMSKLNGLTYAEIATELDISVKTVENQIGKALKILRLKLKDTKG